MRRSRLRWRLAAGYAGIALLTALVLGGLLLALMRASFAAADLDRLRSVADRAATDIAAAPAADLGPVLSSVAYGMNTRVQALAADGSVVADSGSPQDIDPASLQVLEPVGSPPSPPSSDGPGAADRRPGVATVAVAPPNPDEARSPQQVEVATPPGTPGGVVAVRALEGPASGAGVLGRVAVAWAVAAAVAVSAAAALGYVLSGRLTRPLERLAEVTDRMATGDLAARADVGGAGEIARLAASFNTMAGRVEATVGSLRRFVSDAAHELGTPLTALRTDLELIEDGATDADGRRLAARALRQEQRLEDLGTGLLRLSRLEAPNASRPAEPVDLSDVANAAAQGIASRADQRGIGLVVETTAVPVVVIGQPEQLRIAVDNLLDNAVKYAGTGGSVSVGVRVEGSAAVVHVADDGPGIPRTDRPFVFDRFYRASATADRPGTGLGLAIVQGVAQAHAGSVRLVDVPVGTRVELWLPLAAPTG